MARKRNVKRTEAQTADNQVEATETLDADADLAAIEAPLDAGGDAEIEIDAADVDAAEPEVPVDAKDDSGDYVDEALAAMEADAAPAPAPVSDEDLESDAAADVENDAVKAEAYASQTSEIDTSAGETAPEEAVDAAPAEEKPKKEKKAPAPKLSFEEAIRVMHSAEPICLDAEEGPLDEAGIATLIADVPQKKVREKVLQTLNAVISGGKLSVYTAIALELLKTAYHSGEPLTAEQIAKAYEEKGYKSGTVAAQKGQMLVVFSALGMAKRSGSTLTPNPNSVLLDALCS